MFSEPKHCIILFIRYNWISLFPLGTIQIPEVEGEEQQCRGVLVPQDFSTRLVQAVVKHIHSGILLSS